MSSDMQAPQTGSSVSSRYEVLARLGRGGMGTVFKARDHETDIIVALKYLNISRRDQPEEYQRFRTEYELLSSLEHPHIIKALGFGETDEGYAYMLLEFIEGKTLHDLLNPRVLLSIRQCIAFIRQILSALDHVHGRGIIYQDLTPANIMVSSEGRVKLIDFGVARVAAARSEGHQAIAGTPRYMAPEQIRREGTDRRSDIYSFGLLVYELLTGEYPFPDRDARDALAIAVIRKLPPISSRRTDVPLWLRMLVYMCTQKQPALRFQSTGNILSYVKWSERLFPGCSD